MKKITLLCCSLFMLTFCWQGNAQLTEDFESGLISLTNDAGNGVDWAVNTSFFSEGAQSAHNAYGSSDENALVSAALDLSGMSAPRLSFDHIAKTEGGYDICYLEVSVNGTNWTTIATFDEDSYTEWGTSSTTPANDWWMSEDYDLTSYISATTTIRFRLASDSSLSRYGWLLDNVEISEAPTDAPDWANIQWIADNDNATGSDVSLTVDAYTSLTAYAQVYEPGVTDAVGQGAGIECWISASNTDSDPSTWPQEDWSPAVFNADAGNNDEYKFDAVSDFTGTVYVAARWRLNGGPFIYGGFNGFWDGVTNNNIELISNPTVVNDNCDGAIALTVNSDLECGTITAATNVDATESTSNGTSCFGSPNDDVWFSFVATSDIHEIALSNVVAVSGSSTDMYFEVLEGSCGALSSLLCRDPNTGTVSGLTIGSTYLIRVYSYYESSRHNFDVCVGTPPPPPSNDDCANAIELTESANDGSCANILSGTTVSALASSEDDCSTTNKDVWYTITASETNTYNFTVTEIEDFGFSSTYVSVFEGSCGALTQVSSSCYSANVTADLTESSTYYINVRSTSTTAGVNFELCAFPFPPPPENDDCVGAIVLSVEADESCSNPVAGSTVSATESLTGCVGTANDDVWYSFTAVGDAHTIIINNTGGSSDIVTEVFDSCGGTQIVCQDTPNSPINLVGLTPASSYYFRIYTYSSSASTTTDFEVCVGTPPSCTDPSGLSASNVTSTSADLTWTENGTAALWNIVWTAGSDFDPDVDTPDGSAFGLTSAMYNATGLTPETTYYIYYQSDCTGGDTSTWVGPFMGTTLALPPANDECSTAIELTLESGIPDLASATQIPGTILGATDSGIADQTGTANDDVWYSFEATNSEVNIDVTDDFDGVIELFSGDCGMLVSIEYDDYGGPSSNPSISRTDLVVGETYYVRVYYYYSSTTSSPDFTIALWTPSTLSVVNSDFSGFKYFPNPVNDKLALRAKSNIQNVSVFNMLGQEVVRVEPNSISSEVDMTMLNAGAYFVKVTINDTTETFKVIRK